MGSFYFFPENHQKNWIFDLQKSVNFELGNLFKKKFFWKNFQVSKPKNYEIISKLPVF